MELINWILAGRDLRRDIADSRDRLYRVALAWCGDHAVADDLVQETLVLALHRYSQLRDRKRLNAWLHSILSNCWKQHLRRVRPTVELDESGVASDGDAESRCCAQEAALQVRCAILKLPVTQRQALTLVDLGGFSYAEVAEVLNIPMGTVMSRLHAARQSLQKALAHAYSESPAQTHYLRRVK